MPRAVNLEGYPTRQFWAIVQKVRGGETVVVEVSGRGALSLRQTFYAWRRACEALPEAAAKMGVNWEVLRDVAVTLTDKGLEFLPAGEQPMVKALEKALGGSSADLGVEEVSESMKRLQEMLKRGGDAN